jgi:hypothetical protein
MQRGHPVAAGGADVGCLLDQRADRGTTIISRVARIVLVRIILVSPVGCPETASLNIGN